MHEASEGCGAVIPFILRCKREKRGEFSEVFIYAPDAPSQSILTSYTPSINVNITE